MSHSPAAEGILAALTDPANRTEPAQFPSDRAEAARPGMYAWWADDDGRQLLGEPLGVELPALIYVGQAGATRWPSGRQSKATLLSRIGRQHIRGNARSSTFRLTISVLLFKRLGLAAAGGGKLDPASNATVSAWIGEHLAVAIVPYDDRDTLSVVEAEVVTRLDPPLNLGHCLPSEARGRLSDLRRSLPRR